MRRLVRLFKSNSRRGRLLADERLGNAEHALLLVELLVGGELGNSLVPLEDAALTGQFGGHFQAAIEAQEISLSTRHAGNLLPHGLGRTYQGWYFIQVNRMKFVVPLYSFCQMAPSRTTSDSRLDRALSFKRYCSPVIPLRAITE